MDISTEECINIRRKSNINKDKKLPKIKKKGQNNRGEVKNYTK